MSRDARRSEPVSSARPNDDPPTPRGPARELPSHIQAQLRSAGGQTDTGGQPWQGRDLEHGHGHLFPGDSGAVDAALESALAARSRGEADEAKVVAALAAARVFVPVVAEVSASTVTDEGLAVSYTHLTLPTKA